MRGGRGGDDSRLVVGVCCIYILFDIIILDMFDVHVGMLTWLHSSLHMLHFHKFTSVDPHIMTSSLTLFSHNDI